MWFPDKSRLVKVLIHANGEDPETVWAEDLGASSVFPDARLVRVANVPFLHAKPTYEDAIVVEPDQDGRLTWSGDVISADAGRWIMILDYRLNPTSPDGRTAFELLGEVAEKAGMVVEGCWGPGRKGPGRFYVAVPREFSVESAFLFLHGAGEAMKLKLVHPLDD